MIRPLDNERCNRGITFKRNKIMRKQINNLIIALAFISTLGCLVGCVKKEREKSRQAQTVTSSTTKEDKENHGLGLITINNIILKYNGSIDYSVTNQSLVIDITLLNVLKI